LVVLDKNWLVTRKGLCKWGKMDRKGDRPKKKGKWKKKKLRKSAWMIEKRVEERVGKNLLGKREAKNKKIIIRRDTSRGPNTEVHANGKNQKNQERAGRSGKILPSKKDIGKGGTGSQKKPFNKNLKPQN